MGSGLAILETVDITTFVSGDESMGVTMPRNARNHAIESESRQALSRTRGARPPRSYPRTRRRCAARRGSPPRNYGPALMPGELEESSSEIELPDCHGVVGGRGGRSIARRGSPVTDITQS